MSRQGAVACGHEETARAAVAVLEDGGNAFDAILAAMCMACVAEPVLASIGGGGFLMARPTTGRLADRHILYDFFTQTPMHRRPESEIDFYPVMADFGPACQEFHIGMGAIATPGVVRGLFDIHRDLGRMPLRQVVEPAVNTARAGVRLSAMQAHMLEIVGPIFRASAASRALYGRPEDPGALAREGDLLRNGDFAEALETIAIEGADLFYRGEIAQHLAADCRQHGGHLSLNDLEAYRVERRTPLTWEAFLATLSLNPPPSTGGILIAFAMSLLQDRAFRGVAFGSPDYVERLCRVMEATSRARIECRLHELEADAATGTLLDPSLLALYRDRVFGRATVSRGTTHISVIDAAANAAAITLTNGEGAGYILPGTGIMMNNMLGEEDINPHGFHRWPSDTRMASMMAPTLVVASNGDSLALGSGGSNRIRTAILQVLIHLLIYGGSLEEAIGAPRLHLERGTLSVEPGFTEAALEAVTREDDKLDPWPERNLFFGGVHAVRRDGNGRFAAAGDPRRGGVGMVC